MNRHRVMLVIGIATAIVISQIPNPTGSASSPAPSHGNQLSRTSTIAVTLSNSAPEQPSHTVFLAHGNGTGEVGYVPSTDSLPYGIADFDVDPDGNVYLLDSVNRRVVVLDAELRWLESFDLPEQAHKLKFDEVLYIDPLSTEVLKWADHKLGATSRYDVFDRERYLCRGPAPIVLVGERLNPVSYVLEFYTDAKDVTLPYPYWSVKLPQAAVGMGLAAYGVIAGSLFLRADYDLGDRTIVGSVYRMSLDGKQLAWYQLPDFTDVHHRLPISAKVSESGDIVTVKVFPDRTQVIKWDGN